LAGKLSPALVEAAFNEIIRRHETLRTRFTLKGDEPVQVVEPSLSISVPVVDLRHLPESSRSAEADRLAAAEAIKPFGMRQAPLVRAALVQLGDEQHVLLVTVHHAVADGWSIGVITDELAAIYDAYAQGSKSPLPDLAIQYGDYAVWEQKRLLDGEFENQLSYWKQRLANAAPLALPTDSQRPNTRTFDGDIQSVVLPKDLTNRLRELSQQHGCTLYTAMLAAFKVVLARWAESKDIIVGTLVAGRNEVQLENQIGTFVNSLVLRTDFSGNPSLSEILKRVNATVLEAFENQDVPFETVISAIPSRRDRSGHPLFRVNTIYQRDFVKPRDFDGVQLSAIPSKPAGAIYDINFFLVERAEGWRASIEFNTALYRSSTIKDLLTRFQATLNEFATEPDNRLFSAGETRGSSNRRRSTMRSDLEEELCRIWSDVLQVPNIDPDVDFFEAGGHSLLAVALLARVERELGKKIPITQFFEASTIAHMAEAIDRAESAQRLVTISAIRAEGSKPPLFLVHGVGGTVLALGLMVNHLPTGRPVYAVQSPPLDGTIPPPRSLEEMAARYVEEIRTIQPEGPYHFLGYSLGGLIAFEMAQQFYQAGQEVAFLGMLDTFQLGYWERASTPLRRKLNRLVKTVQLHANNLIKGPNRLDYLTGRIRSKTASLLFRFSKETRPALANKLATIDNINAIAARKYKARPYPGSLVLFRATDRDDEQFDYLLGWGGLARAGIEVYDIPGHHDTMNQEPHVQALAARLQFCLEKAASVENLQPLLSTFEIKSNAF
jgi:thioesterase domain-containing protein/acyl carrier protein